MARTQFYFSRACTCVTLLLELLDHARSNLMSPDYLTGTSTLIALFYMVGVIGTAATTVWTDNFAIILKLEVRSRVELRQRDYDFKVGAGTCLFYPIRGSITLS